VYTAVISWFFHDLLTNLIPGIDMSTQAITINEVEWRSAEVKAQSGRILSTAYQNAKIGILHVSILRDLGELAIAMRSLLAYLHTTDAITVLESTSPEDRGKVGANLRDAADKVQVTLARLRTTDFGYWKRFYYAKIGALDKVNQEFCAHSRAFKNPDAELIVLGKEDQEFLLDMMINPKEPSEDLQRVFTRK
jgi:hypothetical protein